VRISVNHPIHISGLYHGSAEDRNQKNWPAPFEQAPEALPKQTNHLKSWLPKNCFTSWLKNNLTGEARTI
jgi:hypothetical protein